MIRIRLAATLRKVAARLDPAPASTVRVHIDGTAVHEALLRLRRERGGEGLGLS